MAKKGFPIVPVLLGVGALGALYLLTRPKQGQVLPGRQPNPPTGERGGIIAPGEIFTPDARGGFQRAVLPRYIQESIFRPQTQGPSPYSDEYNRESCPFGGRFIPVDDPNYALIQPPPRIWSYDRYGRQGVCFSG